MTTEKNKSNTFFMKLALVVSIVLSVVLARADVNKTVKLIDGSSTIIVATSTSEPKKILTTVAQPSLIAPAEKLVPALKNTSSPIIDNSTGKRSSNSDGGVNAGGADTAIISGSVVLADPFVMLDTSEDSELQFAPALKARVDLAIEILEKGFFGAGPKNLLRKSIQNSNIMFFAVDTIPNDPSCQKDDLTYTNLPLGAVTERVACTPKFGNKTWIRASLFTQMNLLDQTLLIVHEGLRRISPALEPAQLTDITNGLRISLQIYENQINGNFDQKLTSDSKLKLKKLFKASVDISYGYRGRERELYNFINAYEITDDGGLINKSISREFIHPQAKIGIGTRLGLSAANQILIEQNATLMMTNICEVDFCRIGQNSSIINVSLTTTLERNRKIDETIFVSVGSDTHLSKSNLFAHFSLKTNKLRTTLFNKEYLFFAAFQFDDKVSIHQSNFTSALATFATNTEVHQSDIRAAQINLRAQSVVKNVNLQIVEGFGAWLDLGGHLNVKEGLKLDGITIKQTRHNPLNFVSDVQAEGLLCDTLDAGTIGKIGTDWRFTVSSLGDLLQNCKKSKAN